MDIKQMIEQTLERAQDFLLHTAQLPEERFGVKRCSSFHDIKAFPDMCLPATYNATHALILMGAYGNLTADEREGLIGFFNSYQMENGFYRMPQMRDDQVWKGRDLYYTWQYIDFHVTNYTYGAVKSLGGTCRYPLGFLKNYMEPDVLKQWLNERNMEDPWLEGNNIVNLGSFLIGELEGQDGGRLKELGDIFLDWHDTRQDPETGYWGTNHPEHPASQMAGMAGAAHNYHLYYYFNREIHYVEKIVDYCLDFAKGGVRSACLDVDVIDVLVNMLPYHYREEEILECLEEFAGWLVSFQNEDGGFADEKSNGVRRMDGWAGGYFEPQGLSNCFATWFRSATLAMIHCALFSKEQDRWTFRNTIGIGYFNKHYLR